MNSSTTSTRSSAVRCVKVVKSYNSDGVVTPALRGVNLDVDAGELLMLVGPSGCGKTTLISVIAGILNQDTGECTVLDKNLHRMSDEEKTEFRKKEIGFVFQAYNLIPTLSVEENVAIPLLLNRTPRPDALRRASEILAHVGLGEKRGGLPQNLSGGQQQRVAIARALVHGPRLLVCDEPTSALDHDTGMHIMELFREVALKDRRTLIVVTHDKRIFNFADRIAVMDDGIVVSVGKEQNDSH